MSLADSFKTLNAGNPDRPGALDSTIAVGESPGHANGQGGNPHFASLAAKMTVVRSAKKNASAICMHKLQLNPAGDSPLPETKVQHGAKAADRPGGQAKTDAGPFERQPSGEESWRNLLALDADIYQQKKVRMLTPEARVLINLKLNGPMPVTEAMKLAGVSYRGFYAVIERLKEAGLVGQVKDTQDHRVRQLRLDPSMPIPPDKI